MYIFSAKSESETGETRSGDRGGISRQEIAK